MAADQERFARAAHVVARGLGRIGRERARAGDVTPQQAETIQLIAERGSVSTSLLATLLGIDPSTASRNLAGLERAGYITDAITYPSYWALWKALSGADEATEVRPAAA